MKLPFLRALRAAFPGARITWFASQGETVYRGVLAPLVQGLLDEIVRDDLHPFVSACRRAGRRFDVVIDTQRGLATAWKLRSIPHRTFVSPAFGYLLSSRFPPSSLRSKKSKSLSRQLLDLVELASGTKVLADTPIAIPGDVVLMAEALLPQGPHYVGLAPGAGGKHKCWPLDRYVALAERLVHCGAAPVFILGPAEGEWVEPLRAAVPAALFPLQLHPAPTPVLTIALAARMACAVANDSGTGHMLAAAAPQMVSLFGPTPARKFAPRDHRITLIRAQDFGSESMDAIPVEAVEAAVRPFLP